MKMNRVIALMIGLLLTFSMTACGEQMSAMNTDMEEKTEEKSAMDMDEKMEESSDMNMMEGKTEEQLLAVENDILFANNALWEKVFMSMDKNVNDDMLSSNYGDVLMSAVEGAKDQFSAEEYEALKADAEKIREIEEQMEDRLKEAQIDCRVSVPEKEIHLELDGEKTYRCLENLLTNVCKYALPGTRAYLNLYDKGDQAEIVLKNISRDELTMDVEELTERFMRGDKSRNTEGSGLGLAIVKSFVELQGGSFHIEADGDLFKAKMSFPKEE